MSAAPGFFDKLITCLKPDKGSTEIISTWSGSITKSTLIKKCPFVVLDTELSGLDPRKDFMISIGAVKMTGGTINLSKEFYQMISPEGDLTKKNIEIHGLTPDELKGQMGMDEVLADCMDFIKDSIIVGHFINIDVKFINKELKRRYNIKLANPAVDTHTLHEWLFENSKGFNKNYRGGSVKTDLFSIAHRYGIPIDSAHNALSDAYITAQLFQKFLYFLHADGVETVDELFDIGRA